MRRTLGEKAAKRILLAAIIVIYGFSAATVPALADGGGTNTGGNQTCNDNGKC